MGGIRRAAQRKNVWGEGEGVCGEAAWRGGESGGLCPWDSAWDLLVRLGRRRVSCEACPRAKGVAGGRGRALGLLRGAWQRAPTVTFGGLAGQVAGPYHASQRHVMPCCFPHSTMPRRDPIHVLPTPHWVSGEWAGFGVGLGTLADGACSNPLCNLRSSLLHPDRNQVEHIRDMEGSSLGEALWELLAETYTWVPRGDGSLNTYWLPAQFALALPFFMGLGNQVGAGCGGGVAGWGVNRMSTARQSGVQSVVVPARAGAALLHGAGEPGGEGGKRGTSSVRSTA